MKKEYKKYALVEYFSPQIRYYDSREKYEELLEIIKKYNNSAKSRFFLGNAKCEKINDNLYRVTVHAYHKLTPKMRISELDEMTYVGDEMDLINRFKGSLETHDGFTPDIQIMYFEDKNKKDKTYDDYDIGIKYIPVLYRPDILYMTKGFNKDCIRNAAKNKDIRFFKELANEFCVYHVIAPEIEKLRKYINLAEYDDNYFEEVMYAACRLLDAFVVERDSKGRLYRNEKGETQVSRRRMRDFGFFVRDYMLPEHKKISPVKYNQKLTEEQYRSLMETTEKHEQESKKLVYGKAEQLRLF